MNIVYKRKKVLVPHCGICGEELFGNGSLMLPYRCSCGEWEHVFWFSHEEFKVNNYTLKKDRHDIEKELQHV